MLENDTLGIAAHLHVLLRRKLGRVTDVEWLVKNREYAQEIIRISRSEPHPDLHEWAARLEAVLPPPPSVVINLPAPRPSPVQVAHTSSARADPQRYIGRLR
jgi:hypothetical protein